MTTSRKTNEAQPRRFARAVRHDYVRVSPQGAAHIIATIGALGHLDALHRALSGKTMSMTLEMGLEEPALRIKAATFSAVNDFLRSEPAIMSDRTMSAMVGCSEDPYDICWQIPPH